MEIVINIPEKLYYKIKSFNVTVSDNIPMASVINDGIPLPKGHGDLIDRNKLLDWSYAIISSNFTYKLNEVVDVDDIKDAPTIIKADKEVE